VFRAFHETPLAEVRVVMLGKDPYPEADPANPGKGIADGLAFSSRGFPVQKSLGYVLGQLGGHPAAAPVDGDLLQWAQRGILLLNSSLTIDLTGAGIQRHGHFKLWRQLICQTLIAVSARSVPVTGGVLPTAFMLLGAEARDFEHAILNGRVHSIQVLRHPSRGGWPAGTFATVDQFLGPSPNRWAL
jgi:uracil-DNA glycosylase